MLASRSPRLAKLASKLPRRTRVIGVALILALAAAGPYLVPKILDLIATPAAVRAQDAAEKGLDQEDLGHAAAAWRQAAAVP